MSLLTIDIRKAEPVDANAIADVHAQSWQGAYAGMIPHKALTRMINRRGGAWWLNAIERNTSIHVLDMNGTVCGYVTFGLNRTRALPQEGEVYELYLKPEYQGIGLGRRLFESARQTLAAHGCTGLVVWSLDDNDAACAFYAAMGGMDRAQGNESFDGVSLRKIAWLWDS